MTLRIVADENMPFAAEHFGRLGEVTLLAGRRITADDVRDADLLMVRSVTRVNRELLAGSRVRFVGTATIGTDHVDLDYLRESGIGFASAPGCNAESVAQYVAAALAFAAGRLGLRLSECSLGIVGVGNCGSRVRRVAEALGLRVVLNDPPLARATGDSSYRPLDELMECDFVTLHVPLTRGGDDPTWRLFDGERIARLKPAAVLINASRGGVIDEGAWAAGLSDGPRHKLILDAWEGEPSINPDMLRRALVGTPHIAGYSYDGKVAGTRMIYEAACRWLGREAAAPALAMPPAAVPAIRLNAAHRAADSILAELVLTAYPILRDDADLRTALHAAGEAIGAAFDERRKRYPLRREFAATTLTLEGADEDLAERVRMLGFTCRNAAASR
ncbi:MAG TPA: 4-phosphoerythronate dehydrogenase [Candidatus Sumerlaeota bacterium]|nr:4-phosphoerythronate dehydrogenase [Candidatus Sumerlaeota bacterium]HPK01913.1 4-phosphoerythronate dehydrogenase [Candidatus Sumerlaeota bacterium]